MRYTRSPLGSVVNLAAVSSGAPTYPSPSCGPANAISPTAPAYTHWVPPAASMWSAEVGYTSPTTLRRVSASTKPSVLPMVASVGP